MEGSVEKVFQEVLAGYLSPRQPFRWDDGNRYSTLICGARDARGLTRRNLETGQYEGEKGEGSGSWPGAILYCTLLDQIGGAFYNSDIEQQGSKKSAILKAIKYFGEEKISDEEIHALIGLRNAFFHDFNLINPTSGSSQESKLQQHRYTVYGGNAGSRLVELPKVSWNGDYENKDWSEDTVTVVSLFQIGELVETILVKMKDLLDADKLKTIETSPKGFVNRYTFKML